MERKMNLAALVLSCILPIAAHAADTDTATEPPAGEDETVAQTYNPPATRGTSSMPSTSATRDIPPMFQQLDTNRDKTISRDEAKRSADVTTRFDEMDTNRDGMISVDEWVSAENKRQR
ncbi:MAG: hypothetical protein HGA47_10060 [Zoogloea sp.]|nr:hypothetical protein [Zoogloea sp.]